MSELLTADEFDEYQYLLDFLYRMENDREALEKELAELSTTKAPKGRWEGYVRALILRNAHNSTYGVVLKG